MTRIREFRRADDQRCCVAVDADEVATVTEGLRRTIITLRSGEKVHVATDYQDVLAWWWGGAQ